MTPTTLENQVQPIASQLSELQRELNIQHGIVASSGHHIASLTEQLKTYQENIESFIKRASDPQFGGSPNSAQVRDAKQFSAQKIKEFKTQIESAQKEKANAQKEVETLNKEESALRLQAEAEYQTLIDQASNLAGVLDLTEQMGNDTLTELRAIATQLNEFVGPLHKEASPVQIANDQIKFPGIWIEEGV